MSSSQASEKHGIAGHRLLRCESWWRFDVPREDEQLMFFLEKRRIFSANVTLAQCSLPLNWFPVDRICRDWFPMTDLPNHANTGTAGNTMVLLDIHLDSRKVKPFRAGFAPLQIITTWTRPVEEFTECSAPSQFLVVVQLPGPSLPIPAQMISPVVFQNGIPHVWALPQSESFADGSQMESDPSMMMEDIPEIEL
jgi:hypothetical protein